MHELPCSVLNIIGEHPLARGPDNKLISRIATVFPGTGALVTLRGPHAWQRQSYIKLLNETNLRNGMEPLSREQETSVWGQAVDLIIEEDETILIRPNPDRMELAFLGDELLQDLVPKYKIRFLHAAIEKVRSTIQKRGECWRIHLLPKSDREMEEMIEASKVRIDKSEIYYYNKSSGTRFLTCCKFAQLGRLADEELRAHLLEIQRHSDRLSVQGTAEVGFFMAKPSFSKASFAAYNFCVLDSDNLRAAYRELNGAFAAAVPPEYHQDELKNPAWRNQMFAALVGEDGQVVSEEMRLGLSPEFFMRIQWLPGARFEDGEPIYDSIFEQAADTGDPALVELCDENVRGFITNLVERYSKLEYVNIGRVSESLSGRGPGEGRRDVYIAEFKTPDNAKETVHFIRMQKWGVPEHLDEGLSPPEAIGLSQQYIEYVRDRWNACHWLGMNLPSQAAVGMISENYSGKCPEFCGMEIQSAYFEREYVRGIATNKIPLHHFEDQQFAIRFARLLGEAAATNMIVGRTKLDGGVLFDDGDEILVGDEAGMPAEIVVADQTGNFVEYQQPLAFVAPTYAAPINQRAGCVPDAKQFTREYLDAFAARFRATQEMYRQHRQEFDSLFHDRPRDPNGSIAFRWEKVLQRLDQSDPLLLQRLIQEGVNS